MYKNHVKVYGINLRTLAIIPERPSLYESVIFEENQIVHAEQQAFEIIKNGCAGSMSDYEGRRRFMVEKTKFKYKVTIPVNLEMKLFFFPTHAAHHPENCWFRHDAILHTFEGDEPGTSKVILKNSQKIVIPVSKLVIDSQRLKAIESVALVKEFGFCECLVQGISCDRFQVKSDDDFYSFT